MLGGRPFERPFRAFRCHLKTSRGRVSIAPDVGPGDRLRCIQRGYRNVGCLQWRLLCGAVAFVSCAFESLRPDLLQASLHLSDAIEGELPRGLIVATSPAPKRSEHESADRDFGRLPAPAGRRAGSGVEHPLNQPAQVERQRRPVMRVLGVELGLDHVEARLAMRRQCIEPATEHMHEAIGEG